MVSCSILATVKYEKNTKKKSGPIVTILWGLRPVMFVCSRRQGDSVFFFKCDFVWNYLSFLWGHSCRRGGSCTMGSFLTDPFCIWQNQDTVWVVASLCVLLAFLFCFCLGPYLAKATQGQTIPGKEANDDNKFTTEFRTWCLPENKRSHLFFFFNSWIPGPKKFFAEDGWFHHSSKLSADRSLIAWHIFCAEGKWSWVDTARLTPRHGFVLPWGMAMNPHREWLHIIHIYIFHFDSIISHYIQLYPLCWLVKSYDS